MSGLFKIFFNKNTYMGNIEQQVAPVSTPQVVPVVDQALSKKTQFL